MNLRTPAIREAGRAAPEALAKEDAPSNLDWTQALEPMNFFP